MTSHRIYGLLASVSIYFAPALYESPPEGLKTFQGRIQDELVQAVPGLVEPMTEHGSIVSLRYLMDEFIGARALSGQRNPFRVEGRYPIVNAKFVIENVPNMTALSQWMIRLSR